MATFTESFVFGAANSLHCACMCGPLAISYHGGCARSLAHQGGRVLAYALVGSGLGALGTAFGSDRIATPTAWIAFVLAAALLLLATCGERGVVQLPGLGALLQRAFAGSRRLPPDLRALVLGLLTPLLPCGLLWAACAAAALTGSAADGAVAMAGFALGAVPLLLIVQTQAAQLARRLGAQRLFWLQRGTMLLAAGVLVWRGVASLQGGCH